jgi:hypothetical protein
MRNVLLLLLLLGRQAAGMADRSGCRRLPHGVVPTMATIMMGGEIENKIGTKGVASLMMYSPQDRAEWRPDRRESL